MGVMELYGFNESEVLKWWCPVVLCDFPLPGLLTRSEGRIGTTELSSAILFCLA